MRFVFFLVFSISLYGQILKKTPVKTNKESDTLVVDSGKKDSLQIFKPTIYDYVHFTQFSEKKIFDTVFTIEKSYQFTQYNNRENFGKIQFSNIGEGFQNLLYQNNSERNLTLLPTKKSFFIKGIKDIQYYDVKTPATAFYFHNGVRNGATLQTIYTQNVGKRLNLAVEYMGLRSLGLYQHQLASSNNTIFSGHYLSKNSRYEAFAHYIHQNINNEENGGIANLDNFISGDSRFRSRENLTVNLANSYSEMKVRRYYLSHSFAPFDVKKFPFKISHTLFHQANKYHYTENAKESFYNSEYITDYPTNSYKFTDKLSNTVSLLFDRPKFKADAGIRHQSITFGAGFPLILNGQTVDSEYKEQRIGAVGNIQIKLWNKLDVKSMLEFSNGKAFKNYLKSENHLVFEPIKNYVFDTEVNFQSMSPSFNYLMNASYYKDFNYQFSDFKNENITEIKAKVNLKWFDTQVFGNYYRIDNYTYFNQLGKPAQSGTSVNISQIGGDALFTYRKFNLNARMVLQNVLSNKDLLPLPNLVARANFFFQDKAFKRVAEIQAGIKVYYFSKFNSQQYFPLLNEFILPNANSYAIGGQPIADAYFNLKVKRMMIFAEAQHFNTGLMRNKSFAAPYYPIADFRLNLGLVWYLFH